MNKNAQRDANTVRWL